MPKGFNGAAIYRSRNWIELSDMERKLGASMGPRSIDRGIAFTSEGVLERFILLQWGRDLSIAELTLAGSVGHETDRFNGAAIYRSRNWPLERGRASRQLVASMGPRSIDRGIVHFRHDAPQFARASMGPRSIDRGIVAASRQWSPRHRASMGPRSIDRGILAYDRDA